MPVKDNILVLCHSNMHRSPFVAEFIRNSPCGDSYEVRDAGLHVDKEQRVPKSLQRAFQTVSQGSLKSHKSRPVGISDILWADKIIIMEDGEQKRPPANARKPAPLRQAPVRPDCLQNNLPGSNRREDSRGRPAPLLPRNGRIRKSSIKPCLPDSRPSGNVGSPAFMERRGKNPKTGNRTTRNPQQAHSEPDPCPPRIQYRTACTSS